MHSKTLWKKYQLTNTNEMEAYMEVTLEFFLDDGDDYSPAPISGFDVEGVAALAAIPAKGDGVSFEDLGPVYEVQDRIFNWSSPTQLRVEIYVGSRDPALHARD